MKTKKHTTNRAAGFAHNLMLYLLLFFISGNTAIAQELLLKSEYSYRRYTTSDGLPSILNQRIHQDKRGFIWIAGSSGLACFDGFEFKTFLKGSFANLYHIEEISVPNANQQKDNEAIIRLFSNRYIYNLNPDADTLQQAFRFDKYFPTTYSSMTMPAGYGIFYSNTKENENEQYFCAVRDTGIIKLIAHEDLNRLEDHDKAWYDEMSHLLYIPLSDGISVVNSKGRVAFHEGIHAKCFVRYRDALWAVATDGLYRQTSGGLFEKVIPYEMDYSALVLARTGSDGSLLYTDGTSLYRYNGDRIEKIFEANIITDFIVDEEGNIWITTYQGVYNLFNLKFRNYSFTGNSDNMRGVVYDTHGKRIIAGSLYGKLIEISGGTYSEISYPPNPFTSDMTFTSHGSEVDGTVYLPGPGGFLQVKGKQSRWVTFPNALFVFQFVTPLPDGNLLTGGTDLLIKTTPSGKVLKNTTMIELQQRIYSKPCVDRNGRIWIGGALGINIIDGDSVKGIFNDSLAYCRTMNADNNGNIWFASENRLFKAENEKNIRQVRLFDSQITNIFHTQSGNLAVTTLDKIHLFDKDMVSYAFFDNQNGFTGIESMRGGMIEDGSGNLWFPAVECLVTFNPNLLMKVQGKLHLYLLTFSTSTNNIQWEKVSENDQHMDYRHKNIRFNYIGLSYASADNVRYYYRLKGFQDEWSEPVKQREITFNNLPPGDYVFEIYADAGTDESRSETQLFTFSIKSAFWQTAWFLILCIALLMLISAGIALYILRRKNKVLMEKLRAEKELNELRINCIRLKAIPHFNANVLSAIEYYIANRTKEEAMHILSIYSDFTFKTLSDVDKAARPLTEELAYVKMYLDLEKVRFLDKFDFCIDVDESVDKNIKLPNMILHTYCENAVKHGLMPLRSGGLLTIRVTQCEETVCVSVEDNGVGRSCAGQNPHIHSSKQGLSILNRQIEIYNRFNGEKINHYVEDLFKGEKSAGTRFVIKVPLDYVYIN